VVLNRAKCPVEVFAVIGATTVSSTPKAIFSDNSKQDCGAEYAPSAALLIQLAGSRRWTRRIWPSGRALTIPVASQVLQARRGMTSHDSAFGSLAATVAAAL
jgi:hypothetical protein